MWKRRKGEEKGLVVGKVLCIRVASMLVGGAACIEVEEIGVVAGGAACIRVEPMVVRGAVCIRVELIAAMRP
jgi:hypothetical protein